MLDISSHWHGHYNRGLSAKRKGAAIWNIQPGEMRLNWASIFAIFTWVLVVLLLKTWRHTIDTKQDYVNVVIFNKITITTMSDWNIYFHLFLRMVHTRPALVRTSPLWEIAILTLTKVLVFPFYNRQFQHLIMQCGTFFCWVLFLVFIVCIVLIAFLLIYNNWL